MIVQNHSGLSDDALLPLLAAAAKFAGCHNSSTGRRYWRPVRVPVAVLVRRNQRIATNGTARPMVEAPLGRLIRVKGYKRRIRANKLVDRVALTIPDPGAYYYHVHLDMATLAAKSIWQYAVHEFAHVADFQYNRRQRKAAHRPFGQYNRRWGNRPHERRALAVDQRAVQPEALAAHAAMLHRVANEYGRGHDARSTT